MSLSFPAWFLTIATSARISGWPCEGQRARQIHTQPANAVTSRTSREPRPPRVRHLAAIAQETAGFARALSANRREPGPPGRLRSEGEAAWESVARIGAGPRW